MGWDEEDLRKGGNWGRHECKCAMPETYGHACALP